MEYAKIKSVAKEVTPKSEKLARLILGTSQLVSDTVGATLGPGGSQVLIERQEHDLPPMVTKDGVTVFRSLGFKNPAMHCIMEAMRDAATRTATEAGDGTTTATVLANAIIHQIHDFCARNPRVSPQKVVRRLSHLFTSVIEPAVVGHVVDGELVRDGMSTQVDSTTPEGRQTLCQVARISANGEGELADAVMDCFDVVGDEGNVTISEVSGPSHYEVEQLDGFPVEIGYEDCCARYYPKFINDPGSQMCKMENPVFVLYNGIINDINVIWGALQDTVAGMFNLKFTDKEAWEAQGSYDFSNVVVVAHGFADNVLATFAAMFPMPNAINVFPLAVPKSPLTNGGTQFLEDLSAVTGATIFDPLGRSLATATLEDFGPGLTFFEAARFRSTIIGRAGSKGEPWETKHIDQVSIVEQLLEHPESELDKILLQLRLGKLTGGIAKLKVFGSSNGELKEKRDRAEDAVCAVRGAIKHGVLPGSCWTLLNLRHLLKQAERQDGDEVLIKALREPFVKLLHNAGLNDDEIEGIELEYVKGFEDDAGADELDPPGVHDNCVYDAYGHQFVDAFQADLLDSTQAVLEAVRNSISIASLLGTLGGTVVFARDEQLERSEASDVADWTRNANVSEADERA